ncbi:ABC transporter permease [Amycolatopsis cihanbeyliensis]|nr:ABC transporter permease [Amycolatopsis cihanbeyliensis]
MRIQFRLVRRQPDALLTLCALPFTAVILLSIVIDAKRPDLVLNAVLAPALIGLWVFSISFVTDLIDDERRLGTWEQAMAAPAALHSVLAGKVSTAIVLGVLPLGETWLLAKAFFGVTITLQHPWVFLLTWLVSLGAMAGTSLVLVAALLLSRNGSVYGNFLTFPIYLLSGVMVPVSYLPEFVRPISSVVFLSWSADLMRDAFGNATPANVIWRLAAIVGLGTAAAVGGRFLLGAVLRRGKETGTMTYA